MDDGNSHLGVKVPTRQKEALYETAHARRTNMSSLVRQALEMWFGHQTDLPQEAREILNSELVDTECPQCIWSDTDRTNIDVEEVEQ